MRRRSFVALLGGVVASWSFAARSVGERFRESAAWATPARREHHWFSDGSRNSASLCTATLTDSPK